MFVANSKFQNLIAVSKVVAIAIAVTLGGACFSSGDAYAQWENCQTYKIVPTTIYEKKPVTISRWVNETVKERKQVTTYKMITQTEKRERRQITYKPVRTTSEREERVVVQKPVTETLFRPRTTEETTFEDVTDYRDEEYTVRKPVTKTEMREERVTVRKPVTQKLIEVKSTTTYKPRVSTETEFVPTAVVVAGVVSTVDANQRPRMKWLDSGYYTDPASGQTVYRRRGLHWVQPTVMAPTASTVPALVPQQRSKFDYVPETVEERRPIEVTRMVEHVETRRVPIQVEEIVERTETRRVPYTKRIPKTVRTTEQIPYTQTTYKEEVTYRKVPYEKTTYQKVETFEPYEVEVSKWVPVVREVEIPRVQSRRVDYQVMKDIPRVVMKKVPIDVFGNEIGPGELLEQPAVFEPIVNPTSISPTSISPTPNVSEGFGTTVRRLPLIGESVIEPAQRRNYKGTLELIPTAPAKTLEETSGRTNSVLVPESAIVDSKMVPIRRPFGMTRAEAAREAEAKRLAKLVEEPESKTIDETSGRVEEDSDDLLGQVAMPENEPTESGNENAELRPAKVDSTDIDASDDTEDSAAEDSAETGSPGMNAPAK